MKAHVASAASAATGLVTRSAASMHYHLTCSADHVAVLQAVRNFVQLCLEGYYDGCVFHRVLKDFLAQVRSSALVQRWLPCL